MLIAIILIRLFALAFTGQPAQCMLEKDLKRANNILYHAHGVHVAEGDHNFNLKAFEFFAKLNFAKYKFSEERIKNYRIKYWKSSGPEQIRIYEVHSSIYVDTAMTMSLDTIGKKRKYPVLHTFNYRSYFLFRAGKPDLHFTINVKDDRMAFDVGKHVVGIYYEAIAIGEKLPDAKALRNLLN